MRMGLLLPHLLLSYLLILLSSSSSQTPTALSLKLGDRCLHDERSVLLQLQQEFMTNSTILGRIWEPDTDFCSWEGVTCSMTSGHVVGLDLSSKLTSPINSNSSLFCLRNLQRLSLAQNDFKLTSIPSGFDRLASLTHLNLSESCFSGQIPLDILRLTRLVSLDLSSTFSEEHPDTWCQNLDSIREFRRLKLERPDLKSLVQNLTSLRKLYLDGVDISSQRSEWGQTLAFALPNLKVLSLCNCRLSGPIHSSISRLHFLSELRLNENNLSVVVPNFLGNLSHLKTLSLYSCGLYGKFPMNVFQLPNLQILDVSDNSELTGHLPEFPPTNAFRVLSLSETKFYGGIPESISNLKFLTNLRLYRCNFSGPIPSSLDSLTQLVELSINDNSFSGPIRSSLFTLPSLNYLNLVRNQFSGQLNEFPNASFSSLETVYLGWNQLKGQIPKSIARLSRLRFLSLGSNNFDGIVDLEMFQNLKNLSLLHLSSLSIKIGENYFAFPQLKYLALESCHINEFPDFLKHQEKLQYLQLSNNQLHGHVPHWIWKKDLHTLNLSYNSLNFLERPLPNLTLASLKHLDLHSNMLQGSIPIPSPSITLFFISDNRFIGEIPQLICKLSGLIIFDASHNNLSGIIPECLTTIGTLLMLNLQGNGFHGMPQNFSNSSNLRTLNLNGNQIEGKVPKSLSNCTMLEVLDLGRNSISDMFPYWLENLPLLQVLILRSNKFQGPIECPRTNYVFPMLHIMDLSSNGFTGNLPTEYFHSLKAMMSVPKDQSRKPKYIGNNYYTDSVTIMSKGLEMVLVKIITIFISIDLSNNKFQGKIPEVIGDLKSLIVLNLSRNELKGQISSSIGNLMKLESLDLSQNKLSGEIPLQLTSLTFFEVMNLSQNCLRGSIPRGHQFDTFLNISYEGNLGLCGLPLSRKCKDAYECILPHEEDIPSDGEGSESSIQFDWKFILMGYGCGVVIGIVTGNVIFWWKDEWFKRKGQKRA